MWGCSGGEWAVGPMVVAAGSVPHPLRGSPTRNRDDEVEECAAYKWAGGNW